jgi:glycosyltransferase involved in cell wall biosynthesis
VYFSAEPLTYDKLITAIASSDVGLAFYADLDQNMSEILFSSNKIAEYLRCGLPIICSDYPSLKEFFGQHRAGLAVPVEGIPQALETLFSDYSGFSARARSCVESGLNFEQYFAEALEGILNPVEQP